jgi:hypothetical protein
MDKIKFALVVLIVFSVVAILRVVLAQRKPKARPSALSNIEL